MRSFLQIAILFAFAGMFMNVSLVWTCAAWQPWPSVWSAREGHTDTGAGFLDWSVKVWSGAAWRRVLSSWTIGESSLNANTTDMTAEEILPGWAEVARPSIASGARGTIVFHFVEARGWPLLSMRCEWKTTGKAEIVSPRIKVVSGRLISSDRTVRWDIENPRVLPIQPIWSRFLVNTMFYAVVLWLTIRWPIVLRRYMRVRRGLCPRCAYPTGKSQVCTECGTHLGVKPF